MTSTLLQWAATLAVLAAMFAACTRVQAQSFESTTFSFRLVTPGRDRTVYVGTHFGTVLAFPTATPQAVTVHALPGGAVSATAPLTPTEWRLVRRAVRQLTRK